MAVPPPLDIPDKVLEKWQTIIDIIAELVGIPAALIMRLVKSDIEVFVSSKTPENPYHPGDNEHFLGSGLYCETVVNTDKKLLIPNALKDEKWKNNPDIKLNMISYLGYPIHLPNGDAFGTICVLDSKENAYSPTYEKLISNFRDIIQSHLELVYMNQMLGGKDKRVYDYLSEIKTLRDILPICGFCKKIRDDEGYWQAIEGYMSKYIHSKFSHGVCPECIKEHYPEIEL